MQKGGGSGKNVANYLSIVAHNKTVLFGRYLFGRYQDTSPLLVPLNQNSGGQPTQEFKNLLKLWESCISLGNLKSEIPPNCVSSPIGIADRGSQMGLLSFRGHGLNRPKTLGTYPRGTENTEQLLCALCVTVVEVQIIKSSSLKEYRKLRLQS